MSRKLGLTLGRQIRHVNSPSNTRHPHLSAVPPTSLSFSSRRHLSRASRAGGPLKNETCSRGEGREGAFDLSGDGDVKITGPARLSARSPLPFKPEGSGHLQDLPHAPGAFDSFLSPRPRPSSPLDLICPLRPSPHFTAIISQQSPLPHQDDEPTAAPAATCRLVTLNDSHAQRRSSERGRRALRLRRGIKG